jgi:hypothetical protein
VGLPFITAFAKLTKQQALYTKESLDTLKMGIEILALQKRKTNWGIIAVILSKH